MKKVLEHIGRYFLQKRLFFSKAIAFIFDFLKFKKLSKNQNKQRFHLSPYNLRPSLTDNTKETNFDSHYTYHPAWAARVVAQIKPKFHVDISSALYFCSIVSAFVPVKFYDYRPANLKLSKLSCGKADLINLPFKSNSINPFPVCILLNILDWDDMEINWTRMEILRQ